MAIKKGFELWTSTKKFVEIDGNLWVFPHPRPPRQKGRDRLEGVMMIREDQVEDFVEALKAAIE